MIFVWALLVAAAAVGNTHGATSRIVGGQETSIINYPSTVSVENRNVLFWSHICGGTIITTQYVLSVAHCFTGLLSSESHRRIRAGTSVRNNGGYVIGINRAIFHSTYSNNRYEADISILRLESRLTFGLGINAAILPHQGFEMFDGAPVTQVGWGEMRVGGGGDWSDTLREVEVFTINRELCIQRYSNWQNRPNDVSENMICTGLLDVSERAACWGDYGGPVLFNKDILVGIISWQHSCANAYYPLVTTRVSSYSDWIAENVST